MSKKFKRKICFFIEILFKKNIQMYFLFDEMEVEKRIQNF